MKARKARGDEPGEMNICTTCNKTFTHRRHLQRHSNTHKSSSVQCEFCHDYFSRSDVRASHYIKCPKRGDRPIPPAAQRGRKRHVCQECSRRKVRCDGGNPCSQCTEHGRSCVNSVEDSSDKRDVTSKRGDQGSINFILNEVDFLQKFPKAPITSTALHNDVPNRSNNDQYIASNDSMTGRAQEYFVDPILGVEGFLKQLSFNTIYNTQTSLIYHDDTAVPGFSEHWNFNTLDSQARQIRELLDYTVRNNANFSTDLLNAIDLVTAQNLDTGITLYFQHWHKHAPMIHEPSFNPCTASTALVLALFGLGGMYFKDEVKVYKLKLLLDTMETIIFCGITAINYDITEWYHGQDWSEHAEKRQQTQLENVQGTYLFAVLQYWTGTTAARERVRQVRFIQIAQMFRHLDLLVVKHTSDSIIHDEVSFNRWIRRESAIRLATAATLLDNTFGIFNNVAPRFQWSEIDLKFPSDEAYFRLATYQDLIARNMSLCPRPTMGLKESFAMLFAHSSSEDMSMLRNGGLSAWDLQVLLYYLYTHLWTAAFNNPPFGVLPYSRSSGMSAFKTALANWKALWDDVRMSADWDSTRFQNLSEDYYDLIKNVMHAVEEKAGPWPTIPSDCEKGAHLKIVLGQE